MRVNVNEVTHIFYHSLVVDPQKAFYQDNAQTAGFCQWMTTVDEFNAITQQMYDRGCHGFDQRSREKDRR